MSTPIFPNGLDHQRPIDWRTYEPPVPAPIDKTAERRKKLEEMAERGTPGEKAAAAHILGKIKP